MPAQGVDEIEEHRLIELDEDRMRRERRERVRVAMERQGLDAIVVFEEPNQRYLGVDQLCREEMAFRYDPVIVVVTCRDPIPHVWTSFRDGVSEIPVDRIHNSLPVEFRYGIEALRSEMRDLVGTTASIGIDSMTATMLEDGHGPEEWRDASFLLQGARMTKTADEVKCLHMAIKANEQAMVDVRDAFVPGVKGSDLNALFFDRGLAAGAESIDLEPVWIATSVVPTPSDAQIKLRAWPRRLSQHPFEEGDLVLTDSALRVRGYNSDFGKTWICSANPQPTSELQSAYKQWKELMSQVTSLIRPGTTCGDLVRAASAVVAQYRLEHVWLAHGIGMSPSEPPYIGTDLGLEFEDTIELAPGMVLVFEPVCAEGYAAYRSEETIVVTDDGFDMLSSYGHWPLEN